MPTVVELSSPTDVIAFYPDPSVNGWVYDNATLDAWYALAETDPKVNKRPNAHGSYGLGQVFTKEHRPVIVGQYYGASATDALTARNRMASMFSDGRPVLITVTDELGATSRQVWLVDLDAPFRYDFSHFPLDLSFIAPDPRRYAATESVSDGMPSGGTGLVWNLGTNTDYFDWGSAGVLGQVSYTNLGAATTLPRLEVGGAGAFLGGFRITEVETGRELTLERDTNLGEVIVLNSRTQRATLGAGDITGDLSSRDWFSIPASATRRYQITPLGSVTGAPTITLYAARAYL